ncbi:hypothetical protein BK769_13990 [Bacillus thuringiensis serovar kumamtoensis]|uniref:Uncharacterized protein n=1 Tax=Bacillus thuringiensis serovar kumamotoensis TaxID=132267 RepID=A0A9X6JPP6_BACUK|nr:hypothetical protein BK769_13990 [Bacillus thuringiensis serovar kumamtoensis]
MKLLDLGSVYMPHCYQAKTLVSPKYKFSFSTGNFFEMSSYFFVNEVCGATLLFGYAIRHILYILISSMIIYNPYIFILIKSGND